MVLGQHSSFAGWSLPCEKDVWRLTQTVEKEEEKKKMLEYAYRLHAVKRVDCTPGIGALCCLRSMCVEN
jgi:hypothetical protein